MSHLDLGSVTALSPEQAAARHWKARLGWLVRSVGMRQGLIMGVCMVLAGALDYGVNVLAGRWLVPVEYGVFIAVTSLVQVLILLSITIRMVVAFYTADLNARTNSSDAVRLFWGQVWSWACKWGLLATGAMVLTAPLVASFLRLPNQWPLWAASLMVVSLFLRESFYGALQGTQAFGALGLVQVAQALLRLALAALLIAAGWQATGAVLAQPLGCLLVLAVVLVWLRPHFRQGAQASGQPVSWHYSAATLLGLAAFGLLTNLDALFVKRFFSPAVAGDFGPVVTLSRVTLFLPWAIGIVLFPKVTKRQAEGKDPRPILLLALAAALAPGLGVAALYFLFPGLLVTTIFTSAYPDPGVVLGLAGLADTLYAGLFIWLNYSLSLERRTFVYALCGTLLWQGIGMYALGRDSLVAMTLVMVSAGAVGNLAGFLTMWSTRPSFRRVPAEAAE